MQHDRSLGPKRAARAVLAGAATAGLIGWTAAGAAPAGGYADLVERVAPAVVFIEVTAEAEGGGGGPGPMPFPPGSPLEDFFERFGIPMPEMPSPEDPERGSGRGGERMGVGSGFIIDGDGSIVTNNHVVADASEVTVRLSDGRSFQADVVGTDPMTDLALLDVETNEDLPFVSFSESQEVRPGDNVIAVGNPFGLGGTVTSGIVSAVSRDINAGPYDDFIQIDAAINQGNSGGPLFNEAGEVIGVNTAIFSPSGGSVGIGFAVPSTIARDVIDQLRETGSVERGWLGVQIQALSPELAEALELDAAEGALVSAVTPDSPAAEAGIEAGDVIQTYAGSAIAEMRDLPRLVAATRPGDEAEIEVQRGGESVTLTVTIEPLEIERMAALEGEREDSGLESESNAPMLGLQLSELDEETRERAGIDAEIEGALVASVDPDGPSAGQLSPGDVIVAVDGEEVTSPRGLLDAIGAEGSSSAILLRVWRDGSERFVGVRPETA